MNFNSIDKRDFKIITDISEIAPITKLVLAKMGEQGLEDKIAETKILDNNTYDKLCGKNSGARTLVLDSDNGSSRINVVLLRQAPFRFVFPEYLHELGHIANLGLIEPLELQTLRAHVYSEILACAFEGYGKETYNETEQGYFLEVANKEIITDFLKFCLERKGISDVHKKSYTFLYRLFAAATPKYPNGLLKTYKEAYTALKNMPLVIINS